ncbi:hypothetical protein OE09_1578 [Flavobacteriaceae bacterium MAR_2010_72]|nr:hypothetical protein OE09_1578 [Flavobacteriaceae bacterium MAR_2010_72]TVZ59699.1 hypothetical protein NA63_2235 [Flavobacteriaceae bacterium MAR_2010_105]
MSKLLEKITDLNDLVLQGKAMEAFEKYYDHDVIMQEKEEQPTIGKEANRKREEEFFSNLIEFRSAQPLKVTVGENTTMVEWQYDYTHREWGIRNYSQVSVQEWKNGQIIKEKFYYNN